MRTIVNANKLYWLLVLMLIIVGATYIQRRYIVYPQINAMDVPDDVKTGILGAMSRVELISYLLCVVVLMLRIGYSSLCLYIGGLLSATGDRYLKWTDTYNIALKADTVFMVYAVLTSALCYTLPLEEFREVIMRTSLLAFVNTEVIQPVLVTLLGSFNVFELAYWLFMALLMKTVGGYTYVKSLQRVVSSYGLGFVLYLLLIVFVTLYATQQ